MEKNQEMQDRELRFSILNVVFGGAAGMTVTPVTIKERLKIAEDFVFKGAEPQKIEPE